MVSWAGFELGPGFDVLDTVEGPAAGTAIADVAGVVGAVALRGVKGVAAWSEVELRRWDTGGCVLTRRTGGGSLGFRDEFKFGAEPVPDSLTKVDLPDPRWLFVVGPDPPN